MVKDKNDETQKELDVNINTDTTPILYTDNIYITANEDGVVFDIMQRVGSTNRAKVVTRIGMSRHHAKRFLTELSKLVVVTDDHDISQPTGPKKVMN